LKKIYTNNALFLKKKNINKRTRPGTCGPGKSGPTLGPIKQQPALGPATPGPSTGLFFKKFNGEDDTSSAPNISKKHVVCFNLEFDHCGGRKNRVCCFFTKKSHFNQFLTQNT